MGAVFRLYINSVSGKMDIVNTLEIFEKKIDNENKLLIFKSSSVDHGLVNKYKDLNNNIIRNLSFAKTEVSQCYCL